jgi:DNA-binding NtrC family response regulator
LTLRATILIVDDERDVRESTAILVEMLGYRVVTIDDPSEVVETAAREGADVILQDLRMPGINVAGLVAALRSHTATAETPVIFFSASEELPRTAARLGAWGYLQKPFGPEELSHLLSTALTPDRRPRTQRDEAMREVRAMFHDEWNVIAALANYASALQASRDLAPRDRNHAEGITHALLKLEARTDHLRTFVCSIVASHTQGPDVEAEQDGSTLRPPRPATRTGHG